MRTEVQAVAWRSYWPVALLAVTFLAVVGLFGTYLNGRQQVANDRAEKQRRAICAILSNIPGHIPPEIVHARAVFARSGHPDDCQPIARPTVKRAPSPAPSPAPTPTATIIVRPQATATITTRPKARPSATRSPRRSPSPTPSPTKTCIVIICP